MNAFEGAITLPQILQHLGIPAHHDCRWWYRITSHKTSCFALKITGWWVSSGRGSLHNPPPTYSNPALSMSGVKENSLFFSGSGNFFNKASPGNDSICACFSANISTQESSFTESGPVTRLSSGVYLVIKTCEVFLCYVAIVRVRSIKLTSLFPFFTSLVSIAGFYNEDEPSSGSLELMMKQLIHAITLQKYF